MARLVWETVPRPDGAGPLHQRLEGVPLREWSNSTRRPALWR